MPPLPEAVAKLRRHLEHRKETGERETDVSPETLARFAQRLKQRTAPPARPPARPAGGDPAADELAAIAGEVAACRACRLCEKRTQVVPGQGHTKPEIMFIGEGPGEEEDRQGLAFVGRAGQLLTEIIKAMGYTREQVFIGNVVKCRPPDNRTPMPDEMAACIHFLERQIALLKPKVIVALGATAVKGLFNDPKISITRIRGTWMSYQGIDTMPTLHPAYLLRNPPAKKDVWEDMKAVLKHLGRPIPERARNK